MKICTPLSPLALVLHVAIGGGRRMALAFAPAAPRCATPRAHTVRVEMSTHSGCWGPAATVMAGWALAGQVAMASLMPIAPVPQEHYDAVVLQNFPTILTAGTSYETIDLSLPSYEEGVSGKKAPPSFKPFGDFTPESVSGGDNVKGIAEDKAAARAESDARQAEDRAARDARQAEDRATRDARKVEEKAAAEAAKADADARQAEDRVAREARKVEEKAAAEAAREERAAAAAAKQAEKAAKRQEELAKQKASVERQRDTTDGAKAPTMSLDPAPAAVAAPDFKMPDLSALKLPDFKAPDLPDFKAPDLPNFKAPDMPNFKAPDMPNFKAPDFKAPDMPKFSLPKFDTPAIPSSPGDGGGMSLSAPKVSLPSFTVPSVSLPSFGGASSSSSSSSSSNSPFASQDGRDASAREARRAFLVADGEAKEAEAAARLVREAANEKQRIASAAKDEACATRPGGKWVCLRNPFSAGF